MNIAENTPLQEVLQKGIAYPINTTYLTPDGQSVAILVVRDHEVVMIGSYLRIWADMFDAEGLQAYNYNLAIRLASMCKSFLMGNREKPAIMFWEKDKSEWNAQVK